MAADRTSLSIRNAQVTLFFSIASFVISFLSRKFFLDGIGAEVMGLRSIIGGFLGTLSLAELGIGVAVSVSLYQPLHDKDYRTINDIVSLQGWLYRRVALIVIFGAFIISLFFPYIFREEKSFPLYYTYATFVVFLIPSILSYTINYKSIVLTADQKGYKTGAIMSTATLVKSFLQMLILYYLPDPYIYWLVMDLAISLLGVYVIEQVIKREYPWLNLQVGDGRKHLKEYGHIIKQTGQLIVHNVSNLAMSYVVPYVLFKIVSLAQTGNHDNYKNLITNVRTLSVALFTNLGPGTGSLIAEGNQQKIYSFFWEIQSLKYYIAAICAMGLWIFGTPFISIWLGEQYAFSSVAVLLLTIVAYIDFCRGGVDSFIVSYGLFKDVWAPAVQALLTLVGSIALGLRYGLEGVLAGPILGLVVIIVIWKPYYLYREKFHRPMKEYWLSTLNYIAISWVGIFVIKYGIERYDLVFDGYMTLFVHASWITALYSIVLFGLFYATSQGFRLVSRRMWQIIYTRIPFVKQ